MFDHLSSSRSTILQLHCPLLVGQVLPEIVSREDAQALCDIMSRLQSASCPSNLERSLREIALAWEDYYLPRYPVPFFQVRVADVRATGGSLSTALELYEEVRAACDGCALRCVMCRLTGHDLGE